MKKLIYSPDYKEKLIKLRKNLDMDFGRETRLKVFATINHHIQLLKTQNYLGISVREMYGVDCDAYYIYSAHNYIFYEVTDDSILILDIYHEREDHIIKFLGRNAHRTLQERAEEFGGNLNITGELEWDKPTGNEIW